MTLKALNRIAVHLLAAAVTAAAVLAAEATVLASGRTPYPIASPLMLVLVCAGHGLLIVPAAERSARGIRLLALLLRSPR